MQLSSLNLRISSDELLGIALRHAKAMKAIRIKAISLNNSDGYIEGVYSKGFFSVGWNATVSLEHNSSEIGFHVDDLSIDGVGAFSFLARGGLFLVSGMQSREA